MMKRSSVNRWAQRWFDSRVKSGLAKNTLTGYRKIIFSHIMPYFKNTLLSKLMPESLRAFYTELAAKGLSGTAYTDTKQHPDLR